MELEKTVILTPRVGRFFAVDPLAPKYPHNSPYAFSENRLLDGVELEGLETALIHVDARLSDSWTVSVASGIYYDYTTDHFGLFFQYGYGAGTAKGATAGYGFSFYPDSSIDDLKGDGYSDVASIAALSKYGGSLDYTSDNDDNLNLKGTTFGGGIGGEFVIAREKTYMYTISANELAREMFKLLSKEQQDGIINSFKNQQKQLLKKQSDLVSEYVRLSKHCDLLHSETTVKINKEIENIVNELKETSEEYQHIQRAIDLLIKKHEQNDD